MINFISNIINLKNQAADINKTRLELKDKNT